MYRGHETKVRYRDRTRKMRREPTPSEAAMWRLLRNRGLRGLKFRRQHEFLGYILDSYCAERRIAIEVDGERHLIETAAYDFGRDVTFSKWGITVLRVESTAALHNMAVVERDLTRIIDEILARR